MTTNATAQTPVPTRYLAPELRIDAKRIVSPAQLVYFTRNFAGVSEFPASVAPDGRILLTPNYFGTMRAWDTSGKLLDWRVDVGGIDTDIGWINHVTWIDNAMWIADSRFRQVVPVDAHGKIGKSVPYPTWVHPTWAERRRYPLFGSMDALAVYKDGTMLVRARGPRSLLDTPGFDRSVAHLFRITPDGAILREIASFDPEAGRVTLTGDDRNQHVALVPFFGRSFWSVAPDGKRVTLISPGTTTSDSGGFRITAIGENGDTAFNRRYPGPAVRVPKAAVDSVLAKVQAYGATSAADIRARLAKLTPTFKSFVAGSLVGLDHSTWILLRTLNDTSKTLDALILDERGEPLATARIPDLVAPFAVDRAHMWGIERGKVGIIRYTLQTTPPPPSVPTPSPPARTGKASASRGR